MNLKNKRIGYAMTGSFCNFKSSILELKKLVDSEAKIVPIMSNNAYNTNTKFGTAKSFIDEIEEITEKKIIHTIQEAEDFTQNRRSRTIRPEGCNRYTYNCSMYSETLLEN